MDFVYSITALCSVLKTKLKAHRRIGHLFMNIDDNCFMGMMQAMFAAIYASAPPDPAVVYRHKSLLLSEQDYRDWLECFSEACRIADVHDPVFVSKILDQIERMKRSLLIDSQFDVLFDLSDKGLPIHAELVRLRELVGASI